MKKILMSIIVMLLVFSSLSLGEVEAASKKNSFAFEMKEMAKKSYNFDSKNSNSWKFYKKKKFKNSLQYKIFRKKAGKKYDYTFAISGLDSFSDLASSYQIIYSNRYNTQIATLEKEVNSFYKKEKSKVNKLYFTGHSLGGYLASYVVSDIIEKIAIKDIPKSKVKAYTFNSPGFRSTQIVYKFNKNNDSMYPTSVSVKAPNSAKKLKANKKGKYNKYIINYKIVGDKIAAAQTPLGKVIKMKSSNKDKHQLKNFTQKNI